MGGCAIDRRRTVGIAGNRDVAIGLSGWTVSVVVSLVQVSTRARLLEVIKNSISVNQTDGRQEVEELKKVGLRDISVDIDIAADNFAGSLHLVFGILDHLGEGLIIKKTAVVCKLGQPVENFVVDELFDAWDVGWLSTDEDLGVGEEASAMSAAGLHLFCNVSFFFMIYFATLSCWILTNMEQEKSRAFSTVSR